jgi:hypothetical protein
MSGFKVTPVKEFHARNFGDRGATAITEEDSQLIAAERLKIAAALQADPNALVSGANLAYFLGTS